MPKPASVALAVGTAGTLAIHVWACGLDVIGHDADPGDAGIGADATTSGGPGIDPNTNPEAGCGDTESNPSHCGACGHSCLGATCSRGLCTPQVLATGLGTPRGIALDAAH